MKLEHLPFLFRGQDYEAVRRCYRSITAWPGATTPRHMAVPPSCSALSQPQGDREQHTEMASALNAGQGGFCGNKGKPSPLFRKWMSNILLAASVQCDSLITGNEGYRRGARGLGSCW